MLMNKIECIQAREPIKKSTGSYNNSNSQYDSGCILFRSHIVTFFFHPFRHIYIHYALLYNIMARDNFSFAHYLFTLHSTSCSTRFPFLSFPSTDPLLTVSTVTLSSYNTILSQWKRAKCTCKLHALLLAPFIYDSIFYLVPACQDNHTSEIFIFIY